MRSAEERKKEGGYVVRKINILISSHAFIKHFCGLFESFYTFISHIRMAVSVDMVQYENNT